MLRKDSNKKLNPMQQSSEIDRREQNNCKKLAEKDADLPSRKYEGPEQDRSARE
jgi:hypothetical protein